MKTLLLLSAIMVAAVAVPAQAAITMGALRQLCEFDAQGREVAPSAHASCQSYIAGVIDYNDLFKSVGKTNPKVDFCLPPALTYSDLQRIILEYLQKNSAHGDSPASAAVVIALRNEFPCEGVSDPGYTSSRGNMIGTDPLGADELPSSGEVLNTPAQ